LKKDLKSKERYIKEVLLRSRGENFFVIFQPHGEKSCEISDFFQSFFYEEEELKIREDFVVKDLFFCLKIKIARE